MEFDGYYYYYIFKTLYHLSGIRGDLKESQGFSRVFQRILGVFLGFAQGIR